MKTFKKSLALVLAVVTLLLVPVSGLASVHTVSRSVGGGSYSTKSTVTIYPLPKKGKAELEVTYQSGMLIGTMAGYVRVKLYDSLGNQIPGYSQKDYDYTGVNSFSESTTYRAPNYSPAYANGEYYFCGVTWDYDS